MNKSLSPVIAAVLFIVLLFVIMNITSVDEPEPDSVVRIHFADNITPAHQKIIENFNKKYAGSIEVIPVNLPFTKFHTNERKTLLSRALRSKSENFDVFAVDLIWVNRFSKWSQPLDSHFGETFINSIIPEALKSCYVDSTLFAVPLRMDMGTMYYNKDVLDDMRDAGEVLTKVERGITWEEIFSLSKRYPDLANRFYLYQADAYEGLMCSFFEVLINIKPDYFETYGQEYDTPEAAMAVNTLKRLLETDISPEKVTEYKEFESYEYYLEQNGLLIRAWPAFSREYKIYFNQLYHERNIVPALLPRFKGTEPVSVFGGWNLMVSTFSSHKEEAIMFLKHCLSQESQRILYEVSGLLPIARNTYTDVEFTNRYPTLTFYNALIQYGVHRPYQMDYTRVSDVLSHFISRAIAGEIEIEKALQEASDMIAAGEVIIE